MVGSGKKKRSYRIPKEGTVNEAVMAVLDEAVTVRSQTRFHRLVLLKLKEMDGNGYRLSQKRLRKIAARMEEIDLIIHCREGRKDPRVRICPVCGSRMIDIKNSTLYGWSVTTGKSCPTCNFWYGTRKRIPTRYVFTREKDAYIGERK